MAKRKEHSIYLNEDESKRVKAVADASGEKVSSYIRRQILSIVEEEESQK